MKSEQLLVLIGDAKNYFEGTKFIGDDVTLKFVILKQVNSTHKQLLLMEEDAPFTFHAEGVLEYMNNNHLTEVLIFGGAKIGLSSDEDDVPAFLQKSYYFGIPYDDVIIEIVKNIWPKADPYICMSDAKLVPREGKLFTKEELEREIEHARNNM